jgi:ribosome maturation factor RimP
LGRADFLRWACAHFFFFEGGTDFVRAEEQLERLRPVVERVVRDLGLDLFDVQLRREAIGRVLRVVIDRPVVFDAEGRPTVEPIEASIGIEECQRVSDDLGTVLDVEDVVEQQYTLEVSSPGIDRPLRGEHDYHRFAGRLAKIVAREDIDGQTHFEGRLRGVEDGDIVMEVGRGKLRRVPLAQVARAKLAVEF